MVSILSEITTENYLKEIVKYFLNSDTKIIGTKEIAKKLGVTQGTATSMVKKLEIKGFLKYEKHVGCTLTEKGRTYGLEILRRHRLIETFLHRTLKLSSQEIHMEAENLEHAVSDKLVDKIDEFLNYPKRDPHGAAIPVKNQSEYINTDRPALELEIGEKAKIVKLSANKELFKYYEDQGIMPGSYIQIISKNKSTGISKVLVNGRQSEYSFLVLQNIFVDL